jgi:hypothetical protein
MENRAEAGIVLFHVFLGELEASISPFASLGELAEGAFGHGEIDECNR